MAFWENIGQKASEKTAKAVQKAKDLSEITKLNSIISDEQNKIDTIYKQIGKLYYSIHRQDCEPDFQAMITSISECEQKIDVIRKKIQDIKGVQTCEKCGAEMPMGVAFCSNCGTKILKQQPIDESIIICQNCGTSIKKGSRFCTGCGKPVIMPNPQPNAQINTNTQAVNTETVQQMPQEVANEVETTQQVTPEVTPEVIEEQNLTEQTTQPVAQEPETIIEESKKLCPNCNSEVSDGDIFCTECGTKL